LATWYSANLFAIVPLRNIPGAPPPGSWIDQAIVQWVLIALVTAMSLYIFAWVWQGDQSATVLVIPLCENRMYVRSGGDCAVR
jgi:Domain of unknown function (DUF4436)